MSYAQRVSLSELSILSRIWIWRSFLECIEIHRFGVEENCLLSNDKYHMTNIIFYKHTYFNILYLYTNT